MDNDSIAPLWLEGYGSHNDKSDTSLQHYQVVKYKLDKKLALAISELLKKNHLKWDVLLHAAWGLLLSRFSSVDDMFFGSGQLISTRQNILKARPNLLTIHFSLNQSSSIKNIYTHVNTQLEKKETRNNELVPRYLLLFTNDTNSTLKKNLTLDINSHPLILVSKNDNSNNLFLYFSHLFTVKSAHFILEHLAVILSEIANDINQKAILLNLLTESDKKKLLHGWNKPNYDFANNGVTECAHELFMHKAKKKPDNLAVSFNGVHVSYQALDIGSTNLALHLMQRGIKPEDRVCVLLDRTPTLIMVMLAIFKSGATYVPINPKYPPERIDYVLNDAKTNCILVNDIHRLSSTHRSKAIKIEDECTFDFLKEKPSVLLPAGDPARIAYIIYTSGTTGNPKGVMIKHKSLMNLIDWYHGCFEVTEKDRASQFASQGFDPFLCETIPFLATGASVHIIDDNTKLTPSLFFSWMEKEKITVCDLPTAYAQMLFSMTWPEHLHLKTLKIGGENVTRYPTQDFSFDIWNGYGPTETTVETTYFKLYSASNKHHIAHEYPSPPIGKPIIHTEAYVVDKYMQLLPPGIAGELLIGGDGISSGYFGREELTAEKFIPNTFNKSTTKLYKTGDLVRWLPDGNLEYIGRIDHQVKIRGYRIELAEIEKNLNQYPDVSEVIVLAKENVNGEKSLIAYVVPNLDKQRYLYQERCLVSVSPNKYIEAVTEDISKEGMAITGITETLRPGQSLKIHIKLPGSVDAKLLSGKLVWQHENRTGILFDLNEKEKISLSKSIDFYLATHNAMEMVLSATAKRSLRKALKKQLPEYMIPATFMTLMQFPLTFSGKIDVKSLPPPQNYEKALQSSYIPPKTQTEKELAAIWEQLLGKEEISITDNFFDLGGNSLTAAELSVKILEKFNISVPTKILFDLPYISILGEFIDSKGKKFSKHSLTQEEIERDMQLLENIYPTNILSKHLDDPQHILLTGAGGFLGIYLLRELLACTNAKIYCLVRRGEFESAAKRLNATIDRFRLGKAVSLADRRIVVISGDISFEYFGLPLEQYDNLSQKVDLIFHCGAQVNIMASYSNLRNSNVQGTLEVIKFATRHIDKPIQYVSTLSAATMKNAAGYYVEEFPNEQYDELFGGYAISKWISERLLTQLNHRGLPVCIYRSGYISGQTDTGIINLNDALFMLVKGCIQLGSAPEMEEKITILPVDFVSKMITRISLSNPEHTGVYHVDHPTGIMWRDLIAWLNDYGYKIKMLPMHEWQQKLLHISKDNAIFPFLPYYLSMEEGFHSPEADVSRAAIQVKKLGLAYPDLDDKLLNIYFDYLTEIEFLPQPEKV